MLKFSTYEKAFDELLENEGLKKKAAYWADKVKW